MRKISRHTPPPFAFATPQDVAPWLDYFQVQADVISSVYTVDGFQTDVVLALCAQWVGFADTCCAFRSNATRQELDTEDFREMNEDLVFTSHEIMCGLSEYWRKHYALFEDTRKRELSLPLEELMCGWSGITTRQSWYKDLGFSLTELLHELPKSYRLHLNFALSVDTQYALRHYYINRLNSAMRFEAMLFCLEIDPQYREFEDPITYGGTMAISFDREESSPPSKKASTNARRFANYIEAIVCYVCDDMELEDIHAAQALTAFIYCLSNPPGDKDAAEDSKLKLPEAT